MSYISIETNTHLNILLLNLMNCNICPGCPGFSNIPFYPDTFYVDHVYFSKSCSKVVFHENAFIIVPCAFCFELRGRLGEYFEGNNKGGNKRVGRRRGNRGCGFVGGGKTTKTTVQVINYFQLITFKYLITFN